MNLKNKCHFFAVLITVSMFFHSTYGQSIKVGETELIYTEDEIPIRYDGTITTLRKDGNTMFFYHPFGCRIEPGDNRRSRHSWHYGPPQDPLQNHYLSVTEEEFWNYNGYYQDTEEEGIWILAMHELNDGNLLAITHAEINYTQNRKKQCFAIGIGYSEDRGDSWTYCGEIIKAADEHLNVGGGAFILKDEYIYVYYNDIDTTTHSRLKCVARAPLSEVANAAANHQVTDWYKYKDGHWDTAGLSGIPGTNLIPLVYGGEDLHSDAAYCNVLGKYLMTVQTGSSHKLLLFSSEDGIAWKQEAVVDETEDDVLQPYSAFVDFNGPTNDGHVVDGEFYIYFPRKRMADHNQDDMFRTLITIEK